MGQQFNEIKNRIKSENKEKTKLEKSKQAYKNDRNQLKLKYDKLMKEYKNID